MNVQFFKTKVIPCHLAPSEERRALELMELCGRCAYKSEEKITENSAKAFVQMLKSHGHLSVLEHSNVVLKVEPKGEKGSTSNGLENLRLQFLNLLTERTGFHRMAMLQNGPSRVLAVAGNFRSWIETLGVLGRHDPSLGAFFQGELQKHFPSIFPPLEPGSQDFPFTLSLMGQKEQLESLQNHVHSDLPIFVFKFICDRGITHEVVRHRVLSFTQESTRYVNYRNRGMALMVPEELEACFDEGTGRFTEENPLVRLWIDRGTMLFKWYQEDLARGLKPQIARDILPNLLKSEIFVTGRWSGWKHFIGLRDSAAAHPRIRFIAREVRKYFEGLGLSPEL